MRKSQLQEALFALGIELEGEVLQAELAFLDELLAWNRRINLTAITDMQEALEKHLVDSLTVLPLLKGDERLLDIGSGGGLPAIPLKIAAPDLQVTSVEAVHKKIAFQRHAARRLGLHGFCSHSGRIEGLQDDPHYAGAFDLVISRAFASLPHFARAALPFLAPGGRIVAMKGAEGERERDDAGRALEELELRVAATRVLQLPQSGARRCLLILERTTADP